MYNKTSKDMLIISKDTLDRIKENLIQIKRSVGLGNTSVNNKVIDGKLELIEIIKGLGEFEMTKIEDYTNIPLEYKKTDTYFKSLTIKVNSEYNPEYGDNKICECGHIYYRHFDSYENMEACGCKYCECSTFKLKK